MEPNSNQPKKDSFRGKRGNHWPRGKKRYQRGYKSNNNYYNNNNNNRSYNQNYNPYSQNNPRYSYPQYPLTCSNKFYIVRKCTYALATII